MERVLSWIDWWIVGPICLAVVWVLYRVYWVGRSRRPAEDGFPFVYVNQDGGVRELSVVEREYLSEPFHPADGGRPYIKAGYRALDGWGSLSGYLARRQVPARIPIQPVNPEARHQESIGPADFISVHRAAGDIVTENPDGSVTCAPDPQLTQAERFARLQRIRLEEQRAREQKEMEPPGRGRDEHDPAS